MSQIQGDIHINHTILQQMVQSLWQYAGSS